MLWLFKKHFMNQHVNISMWVSKNKNWCCHVIIDGYLCGIWRLLGFQQITKTTALKIKLAEDDWNQYKCLKTKSQFVFQPFHAPF